jgi:arsenate reductase
MTQSNFMTLANSDKQLTLIYHSEEHIGRQVLAYTQAENIPIHDIDLAHVKLTPTHWAELASKMRINVKDLVNTEHPDFSQKFESVVNLLENDWLTLLVQNPEILKGPILIKGDKIAMLSNPQDMLHFVK